MEAQAAGLPVISTWHSGIPELVVDGQSGLLVPERDPRALADGLQFLIEHHHLWPEMGRRGRKIVEEQFDIESLNHDLVRLYERTISNYQTAVHTTSRAAVQ
jgi:colanic acid/amylovoran biosynthesis glycosyltransferase